MTLAPHLDEEIERICVLHTLGEKCGKDGLSVDYPLNFFTCLVDDYS
jgi:hypothetical protein